MRTVLLAALLVVCVAACDGNDPVAAPTTLVTSIESAQVFVGGMPVGGSTITGEQGQTLFEIRLRDRDRLHLDSVEYCAVQFDLPGHGHMAQRRSGEQICFDDGTRGDDMPGDGLYHWADVDDSIGCGRAGSPMGSYRYSFRCEFNDGSQSEVALTVTRQ
jgi:hypothetical protein